MSHFAQPAIHPVTGKVETATWVDHGAPKRHWTVLFRDGSEYPEAKVRLPEGSTYQDILTGADPAGFDGDAG